MSRGSGTSSEQACSQTWEYCRVSKRILSASMSTASCSSPKELTQAVLLHEAVRTLKAIWRPASPMELMSLRRDLSPAAAASSAQPAAGASAEVLGDSLEEFLVKATGDKSLRKLMSSMGEAGRQIAFKVRTASCNKTACVNSSGDEQLAVDMLADKILFETLKYSGVCKLACSEEVPEPLDMGGSGFSVAFDPLDGSSIVDTNFSVGTIFGVWPGDELTNVTGRDQAAAAMGIYGPRTVYCLALKDYPGCHEFLLQDDGKFIHVKETTSIAEGKMFSPGNLRATCDTPGPQGLP